MIINSCMYMPYLHTYQAFCFAIHVYLQPIVVYSDNLKLDVCCIFYLLFCLVIH